MVAWHVGILEGVKKTNLRRLLNFNKYLNIKRLFIFEANFLKLNLKKIALLALLK